MKLGKPVEMSGPVLVRKGDGDTAKAMKAIADALEDMADAVKQPAKPAGKPETTVVNVEAPSVTVSPILPKPVKWRFTHSYDSRGNLTETLAEPA